MSNREIPPFDPNNPPGQVFRNPGAPAAFTPQVGQVRETLQGGPVNPQAFVHPALQGSPSAIAYEAGMRARAQRGLPKYNESVPGAGPAMPPLEAQHTDGLTIAQQAAMHGLTPAQKAVAASNQPGSIVDPTPYMGGVEPFNARQGGSPPSPEQLGIQQNDTLPEQAQNDPAYIRGQGAQLAMYQTHMALKYGVIRNGQHIPPQALQANMGGAGTNGQIGNRPLSNTLEDLRALTSVQPHTNLPKTEEEAVASGPPVRPYGKDDDDEGDRPKGKLSDAELRSLLERLDDFDYDALRQQMNKDVINNEEQRAIIEGRLEPLSVEQLIMSGRTSQRVPIIPGKLEYTFRSMDGGDDLAVKRIVSHEVQNVGSPGRYYLDRFSLMTMCAGITHINNTVVPEHLDQNGVWDDKLFLSKLDWMMKRPLHMIASISTNHSWFELRARKLFVAEKVKNG